MVVLWRSRPWASSATTLHPVRKPGSTATIRFPRNGASHEELAQVRDEDADRVAVGARLRVLERLAFEAREEQALVAVLEREADLVRGKTAAPQVPPAQPDQRVRLVGARLHPEHPFVAAPEHREDPV
jgi:hypothetical protein